MDIKSFVARMQEKRKELEGQYPKGYCLVQTVFNPNTNTVGGVTCEVSVDQAARLITEGSHRLATKEEAEVFRKQQEDARADILAEEIRKRQQFFAPGVPVPFDLGNPELVKSRTGK